MKKLEILGTGCPKCDKLYREVDQAAGDMGLEYEISKVSDINTIISHGVMVTPALVVDGVLRCAGKVPTAEQIREMIGAAE